MNRRLSLSLFLALIFTAATAAFAQSTASITGTVADPTGAVVSGAHVVAHSLLTDADRDTTSDGSGSYVIPSLQPGTYKVTVTAPGFAAYTVPSLELHVSQIATINAALNLAAAGETVAVESAATSLIEASTMTVGQVIDKQTVQEIPLNGRHFLDLTVLTPGGVVAPTAGSLTAPSRGLGANSFITAGNREDSVNFQINGINLNDAVQNQITFQPSINTTSEFKITNSTYSAEYGRSSGSIVNVSTRSGTSKIHGEVFDYLRNNSFDARNYFNRKGTPQASFKRNNFGAALGGPIWKDHTFLFLSYEGLRQHQGITLNGGVLTLAQRALVASIGNPSAVALTAIIPLPNDATGTRFIGTAPGPVQIDQGTADVLHQINAKDQLHAFYAFQSDVRTEPALQGNNVPGYGDHRNAHRQIFTLNETHVFNARATNEARLGLNRIAITFNPNLLANPVDYSIGDGITTAVGLPQITITDVGINFGGPSGFPQGRYDTMGIFSDTATFIRGKHTIKFGGEFRRFINDNFTGDTGTLGFNTFTNFSNGKANSFAITPTTVSSRIFTNAAGVFLQDNYKLTPNLTLEGGVRYEWNGTPTEGANRFVVFDFPTASLVRTGTNGLGSIYKQNHNIEPRLGFAWDITGRGESVVRGGYGFIVDQPTSNAVTALASNPPLAAPVSYSSATVPINVSSAYASAAASGITVSTINPRFRNAYIESFNLNVQQKAFFGTIAQVGYYGSVGRHLRVRTNGNQPNALGVRPFPSISATSSIDPGFASNSNFATVNSIGVSNYNAMWATLTKDFHHGLQFNMTYSWSKSLDLNSLGSQGGYVLQDSTNPANNYGPSDYDVRNRYVVSAIYNLPYYASSNRLLAGWRLATIAQYQSGNPVNIVNTSTFTGVSGVIRPNLVGPVTYGRGQLPNGNVSWITSTGICTPATTTSACTFQNTTNTLGNLSRNSLIGPAFANVDLSLEKNTKINERITFQIRADSFDITNHPNFAQPSSSDTSTTFGQISATRSAVGDLGSSRQTQLIAKIIF